MTLIDSQGHIIKLGNEIAKGGEGTVYNIEDHKNYVVKLYNDKLLKSCKLNKLKIMISLFNKDIGNFAAWPRSIVLDNNIPCGFIMEKFSDYIEIHQLYGSSSRKKYFPKANWQFLVHTARNLACAIETLHKKNIVIGDINQGNILVNKQAMVKFIDCDSYQIEVDKTLFLCEVGVPEYTPPELQNKSFRDTRRTFNHDNFALAVLIFKILMMGRHPYSGDGAPSEIGEAISKNYFCYGETAKSNGIYTHQASFMYETLDIKLQNLFDKAFTNGSVRPNATLWKETLSDIETSLKTCSKDPMHLYSSCLNYCPWCEFEKQGLFYFGKSPYRNAKRHSRKLNNNLSKPQIQVQAKKNIYKTSLQNNLPKRPKYITKQYLDLLLNQLQQISKPQHVTFNKLSKPIPTPWSTECKKSFWQVYLIKILQSVGILILFWILVHSIKSPDFSLMKSVVHSVLVSSIYLLKPYNHLFKEEFDKRKKELIKSREQLKLFKKYWLKGSSDKRFKICYKKAKITYSKALKITLQISKANNLIPIKMFTKQKKEFLNSIEINYSTEINIKKILKLKLIVLRIKTAADLNSLNLLLLGNDGKLLKKWRQLKEEKFLYKNNYSEIKNIQENIYKKYKKRLEEYTYALENSIQELQVISNEINLFRNTKKSELEALRQKYLKDKLSLKIPLF